MLHVQEFFEVEQIESQESQQGEKPGERQGVSPPIESPIAPQSPQESQHGGLTPCRSPRDAVQFGTINPDHIRRIVQSQDGVLFDAYFHDALSAGWSRDTLNDRLRMAGLFHQVLRIENAKPAAKKSTNLGGVVGAAWKNRDSTEKRKNGTPKALKLSKADEEFASKLLRPKSTASAEQAIAIVNPLRQVDERGIGDLSAADIQRQQEIQQRSLALLRR